MVRGAFPKYPLHDWVCIFFVCIPIGCGQKIKLISYGQADPKGGSLLAWL